MVKLELMDTNERNKWHCYHCGETKSVKYKVHIDGTVIPVCNMCVIKYHKTEGVKNNGRW